MSDVMYHLYHVRKADSKSQHRPLVRFYFRCQMSGVRCQVSSVKFQVSNITSHILGVRCHLLGVMCHIWNVRNVRKGNIKSQYCPLVRCCVRCHLSCVTFTYQGTCVKCHVLCVTCQVSGVMCLQWNVRKGNSRRHWPGTGASSPTKLGNMVKRDQKVML